MTKALTPELSGAITRVGIIPYLEWLKDNGIEVGGKGNIFDNLEESLKEGKINDQQLWQAVAELEENSNKKIILFNGANIKSVETDKKDILAGLKKEHGIVPSAKNYQTGTPTVRSSFIYMFWNDDVIKIKYMEKQFVVEADIENEKFVKTPLFVCVIVTIDLKSGFTQLRLDTAGDRHQHKNDLGKISESAYEQYYVDLLRKLFPSVTFSEIDLNITANYIANTEKKAFRLNKGVTTITNGAKQTYSTATMKADVRDLPEYAGAFSKGSANWRAEELTGYWLADQSDGLLKRDLFMRISRKKSHIRVQRGCLEKELNYGIAKIRHIQGAV